LQANESGGEVMMDSARYAAVKARVQNLYALSAEGRWDEVEAQLTDDFRIVEADSLPFGGDYRGRGALRELYTIVFTYWADPKVDIGDITISEDHAVALLTLHATPRGGGQRLAVPLCEVFHLRGDMICGITPYYFDTAAIVRAGADGGCGLATGAEA